MALQDILKKIIDEAQQEVDQIEINTQEQKKVLGKKSVEIEKTELTALELRTASTLESVEKKILAMAHRENSKMNLEMKHTVIKAATTKVWEYLINADEKTYGELISKLFLKLGVSSGKVLTPPKRMEITTKFAPQGFSVVACKDIKGGFILESGEVRIDNSFRNLVFEEYAEQFMLFFADELKLV